MPTIAGAEYVNDDELCANCHGAYAKSFAENVHRGEALRRLSRAGQPSLGNAGQGAGADLQFQDGRPGGAGRGMPALPRRKQLCRRSPVAALEARQLRHHLRQLSSRTLQRPAGNAGHDPAG